MSKIKDNFMKESKYVNVDCPACNSSDNNYLFKKDGFSILEVITPGKLDAELARKKAIAGEPGLSIIPFLKELLLDSLEQTGKSFQELSANNKLSSHLWIVAKK